MPHAAPRHRNGHRPQPTPRGTTAERGYGARWQKLRAWFLGQPDNALCCVPGCNRAAEVADHKTPHKGDPVLLYDVSNLQPMCKRHHDEKTAREDGGFGRKAGGA